MLSPRMKTVCLALALANLGFFAWAHWLASSGQSTAPADTPDAPQLILASEATQAPRQEGSAAKAEPVVAAQETALPAPETSAEPPAPKPEPPAKIARCVSVGPFHDLPDATQAAVALRAKGFAPRTRTREGDVWAGLWVYIENLPSREEAQRAMEMFKERGITDAYIMPAGEGGQLNISLGIFAESARAQRRATEVRALGFTPTISDRMRKGTVYWLDTQLKPANSMITRADIQGTAGRIVRLEVRPCP